MAERFGKLEVVERDPNRLVLRTPRASPGRWCLFYLLGPSIFIAVGLVLFLGKKPWALLAAGVALLVTVLPNLSSLGNKRIVVDRTAQAVTLTKTFLLLQIVIHIPFEEITGLQLQHDTSRGLKTSHLWKVFLNTPERNVHIDTGTSYHGMHALVAEISQLTGKPVVPQKPG
ncbi:MAG TPA: hypothetical protein EYP49_04705 [Anaerolineae bacterium]|nr:hypothetical protein [Anaerolineae bacterium]